MTVIKLLPSTRRRPIPAMVLGLVMLLLGAAAAALGAALPGVATPVTTGTSVELPRELTPEEVRALIAGMSDDEVRALLIAQLDKAAAQSAREEQAPGISARFEAYLEVIERRVADLNAVAGELPAVPAQIWSQVTAGGTVGGGRIALGIVIVFGVAWLVEQVFRRATRAFGTRAAVPSGGQSAGWRWAALRALVDLSALAVFILGAIGVWLLFGARKLAAEELVSVMLWAVVAVRLVSLALRVIFAPRTPAFRPLPMSDHSAVVVYQSVMVIAAVIILGRAVGNILLGYGVDPDVKQLVSVIWSSLVAATLITVVWLTRQRCVAIMRTGRQSDAIEQGALEGLVNIWPVLVTVYVIGLWLLVNLVQLATGRDTFLPAMISLLLVGSIPFADAGLRWAAGRLLGTGEPAGDDAEKGAHPAERRRRGEYELVALGYLRILLVLVIVLAFAKAWGIDLFATGQRLFGDRVADALLDVAVTALIAYVVWGVVKVAVEHHVGSSSPRQEAGAGDEPGGTGASRVQTLLPLIRKFVMVSLLVIVVLIALSSMGVNIGPLIAGAGVIGIAIGFGAQTLVRDIVSGFFFLLDDAFRMGEYVEVDVTRGTVEKISVRSLQLRHHNGPVHTIPFGEIKHLTNYSRDWAIMKFELRVPFETDINRVRKIIKQIGQEMLSDEELGPMIIEPLKSQGVNRMDDSALILRCKVMTHPGQQFMVRREAYTRIQRRFEEEGIHFAPRRVIVEASSPELAQAAAAAGALDSEGETPAGGKSDDRG